MTLLTFGIARDIIGSSTLSIDANTEGVKTVADLRQFLFKTYPRFGNLATLMIAVNEEYGLDDTPISAKDDIAIIPPVAGG
jgi:sulfur-carrier protein